MNGKATKQGEWPPNLFQTVSHPRQASSGTPGSIAVETAVLWKLQKRSEGFSVGSHRFYDDGTLVMLLTVRGVVGFLTQRSHQTQVARLQDRCALCVPQLLELAGNGVGRGNSTSEVWEKGSHRPAGSGSMGL